MCTMAMRVKKFKFPFFDSKTVFPCALIKSLCFFNHTNLFDIIEFVFLTTTLSLRPHSWKHLAIPLPYLTHTVYKQFLYIFLRPKQPDISYAFYLCYFIYLLCLSQCNCSSEQMFFLDDQLFFQQHFDRFLISVPKHVFNRSFNYLSIFRKE